MKSLQEKSLVFSIISTNYPRQNYVLKQLLGRTIDFSQLSESTLYLIWFFYNDNKEITDKIPCRFIVNDWWYKECKTCIIEGCKVCDSEGCECEDCTCKYCGEKYKKSECE